MISSASVVDTGAGAAELSRPCSIATTVGFGTDLLRGYGLRAAASAGVETEPRRGMLGADEPRTTTGL